MTAREKIDKIVTLKQLRLKDRNELAMRCGILPNTLAAAVSRDVLSDDIVMTIHDKLGVNLDFLRSGKEPILNETNHTSVQKGGDNKEKHSGEERETFYRDLIETNQEYTLMPKAVLRDYKIVPDKLLDIITESKDQVNRELQKKQELLMEIYEGKIKKLEQENEDLRRKIPPQD